MSKTPQLYYASGPRVYQRPLRNLSTGGTRMGFLVCTVSDDLDEEAAQLVADALCAHEAVPEGYEVRS